MDLKIESIPFLKPYFPKETRDSILTDIDEILHSGRLVQGKHTEAFENSFSEYIGTKNSVSTNSCTTALQICLEHYGAKGFEILVPSASFVTDISVVKWAGASPVLVDTDPETLSFDLQDLKKKLTPNTKGIIWVHLIGVISPAWKEIVEFARENRLFLIEDCAHAHGASIDGRKAGSLGDAGCFSFYPTKPMTTGSGGMITTDSADLTKTALELRMFGRENGTGQVVRMGNDWFLDEIRACIGYHQLRNLEASLKRRREIANKYQKEFKNLDNIRLLNISDNQLPAWYHYSVFIESNIDYEKLAKALQEKHGIPTKPIYIPMHQEKIFSDLDDGSLKQTELALNLSLCLPLFVEMRDQEVTNVISALKNEVGEHLK